MLQSLQQYAEYKSKQVAKSCEFTNSQCNTTVSQSEPDSSKKYSVSQTDLNSERTISIDTYEALSDKVPLESARVEQVKEEIQKSSFEEPPLNVQMNETKINFQPKPKTLSEHSKERKVPSTRATRVMSFGGETLVFV